MLYPHKHLLRWEGGWVRMGKQTDSWLKVNRTLYSETSHTPNAIKGVASGELSPEFHKMHRWQGLARVYLSWRYHKNPRRHEEGGPCKLLPTVVDLIRGRWIAKWLSPFSSVLKVIHSQREFRKVNRYWPDLWWGYGFLRKSIVFGVLGKLRHAAKKRSRKSEKYTLISWF